MVEGADMTMGSNDYQPSLRKGKYPIPPDQQWQKNIIINKINIEINEYTNK